MNFKKNNNNKTGRKTLFFILTITLINTFLILFLIDYIVVVQTDQLINLQQEIDIIKLNLENVHSNVLTINTKISSNNNPLIDDINVNNKKIKITKSLFETVNDYYK